MSESFSQYGEDLIVAKLFTEPGNLIELGAWEPKTFSNSRLLIEKGWDATLVELSPVPLRKLVEEYGNNPKVRVVAAAITPIPQPMLRFEISDDACTTDSPDRAAGWKGLREGYDGGFFGQLWVPAVTVRQLLGQFYGDGKQVDFVSIDTEGTSVELAIEFMEGPYKPKVLCAEHDGRIVWLNEFAQKLGYRQEWINGTNVILVRKP